MFDFLEQSILGLIIRLEALEQHYRSAQRICDIVSDVLVLMSSRLLGPSLTFMPVSRYLQLAPEEWRLQKGLISAQWSVGNL